MKKLILVELPDIENEIVGELDTSTKTAFLAGFRQCLDTLQAKKARVNVKKFSKFIIVNDNLKVSDFLTKFEIERLITAIESGELWEHEQEEGSENNARTT